MRSYGGASVVSRSNDGLERHDRDFHDDDVDEERVDGTTAAELGKWHQVLFFNEVGGDGKP